jgi:cytochrome c5
LIQVKTFRDDPAQKFPETDLKMIHRCLICAAFAIVPCIASAGSGKTGEQVYREVCSACHATGVANAPKFGDRKAWASLIREGQVVLTADAWAGVRAMPPRGGRPELTLEEFGRAVAYMTRAAGSGWKDPDAAMLEKIRAMEKQRIEARGSKSS